MYVYIQTEPQLFAVGFYDPHGRWRVESDHQTRFSAAARVSYLNGGEPAEAEHWPAFVTRDNEP